MRIEAIASGWKPFLVAVLASACAAPAPSSPPLSLSKEIKVTRDPIWPSRWRHKSTDWEDIAPITKANHRDEISTLFRFTGTDEDGAKVDLACSVSFKIWTDGNDEASLAHSGAKPCVTGPDHTSPFAGKITSADAAFQPTTKGIFINVSMAGQIGSTPVTGETLVERRKEFR